MFPSENFLATLLRSSFTLSAYGGCSPGSTKFSAGIMSCTIRKLHWINTLATSSRSWNQPHVISENRLTYKFKSTTMKNPNTFSRRDFIAKSALAATGIVMANNTSWGFPAIIKNYGKPNSKIAGVQLGTITYSFRSLPTDAESVMKYCVESGISAIELMGTTAEAFAGAPNVSTEPMKPFTPGPRPELTEEQKAERAKKAKDLADWRSKVAMDKFEQLRKMYKDAGIIIYAYKPNAFGVNNTDAEVDYGMRAAKALGATHVTLEIPQEAGQTKRLSDIAAKNKILVAYHGHEQQTPTIWDAALAESKNNA